MRTILYNQENYRKWYSTCPTAAGSPKQISHLEHHNIKYMLWLNNLIELKT